MGDEGVNKVVLDILIKHINNEELCSRGFWILCNLTSISKILIICIFLKLHPNTEENQVRAGREGSVEKVLKIVKTHINNEEVCRRGFNILFNLTGIGKPL